MEEEALTPKRIQGLERMERVKGLVPLWPVSLTTIAVPMVPLRGRKMPPPRVFLSEEARERM